jgi:hypothetical protein
MNVLSGKKLAASLRKACDRTRRRLWIASPYVGNWEMVRRVIGRKWWDDKSLSIRLLTDSAERGLNGPTVTRIAQRGSVHDLRGLHAKLYIVDDVVLLTSANLTGTAFSSRYESGVWLTGSPAQEAIALYSQWWSQKSTRLNPGALSGVLQSRSRMTGEDDGKRLTHLYPLPRDPGDFGGHKLVALFGDYPSFLDDYRTLSKEYFALQRVWPTVPEYFELDGFLNYLFRDHPDRPSRPFEQQPPRSLTEPERRRELRRLAGEFKTWVEREGNDGRWRLTHSTYVRQTLSRSRIGAIRRSDIENVVAGLNCMNDGRQRSRFLDPSRNSTTVIRSAWAELLYGLDPDTERMSKCAVMLFGFKRSSVQELLGFYAPKKYPLRNATVNAGLRYFGFNVSAH